MALNKKVQLIIDEVGSIKDLALILGVSQSYIRHWRNNSQPIPPKLVNKLVDLSNGKVKAKDLRPDIFRT